MDGPDYVIPATEGGGFAGLTASADRTAQQGSTQCRSTRSARTSTAFSNRSNDAAQGPQLNKALTDMSGMIASAQNMIRNLDTKQLPELVSGLQKTLTSANKLVLSLDSGYGDNTKFNRDMDRLLVQANDALRSIRALSDLLARHPEALIKGRPAGRLNERPETRRIGAGRQCSPPALRRTRYFIRSRRFRDECSQGDPR